MLDFCGDMMYTVWDKSFRMEVAMALRKERPEALELYRKMLVVFAGVAALIPALLNMGSFVLPLLAAVLVCVPALWWKYTLARVATRAYCITLAAVIPVLCVVVACMGHFHTEYFALLSFVAVVLPAAAIAAGHNAKIDIVIIRVLSLVNVVSCGLIIAYVIETKYWMKSVLLGAVALVVFVLSIMICPPVGKKREEK